MIMAIRMLPSFIKPPHLHFKHLFSTLSMAAIAVQLSGCSMMTAAGPSARAVNRADHREIANANILVVDVTDAVARRIIASSALSSFSETFGDASPVGTIVGSGDVLEVMIWEAPPATLFGSAAGDAQFGTSITTARGTTLPQQMVNGNGQIVVPFVGAVRATGRTLEQISSDIASRLHGIAHRPQVIVRLAGNATETVTVVGDIANNTRVPLTAKGERLLDILASAGGVKQPVGKTTIRITRGTQVATLPLETVIRDPKQNIRLQPNDVVTALFQPYSFTALGATGANAEVPFEGTGINLSQAMGRIGGLQDLRANVRGVFLFRLEDPNALDPEIRHGVQTTPDGRIPVIYKVDMKDPATFFIAQGFPIQNHDVIYVSNAPLADIQKFVNVISSTIFPIATAVTVLR
jgi:polysaccharide biosynthesis/export protein